MRLPRAYILTPERIAAIHAEDAAAETHRAERAARQAESQATAGTRARESYLVTTYGITGAQYDAILERQGSACAVCRKPRPEGGRRLHVDHDHKAKRGSPRFVRGLLCYRCNRLLVGVHTVETARAVLAYLEEREIPAIKTPGAGDVRPWSPADLTKFPGLTREAVAAIVAGKSEVTTQDVTSSLGAGTTRAASMIAGAYLRAMGWKRARPMISGKQRSAYLAPTPGTAGVQG